MARKVGGLEEQAIHLSAELYLLIPARHRDRPDPNQPLNSAWNRAVAVTMKASVALEQLGDLLRDKAGIIEPGPTARFLRDREEDAAPQAVGVGLEPAEASRAHQHEKSAR